MFLAKTFKFLKNVNISVVVSTGCSGGGDGPCGPWVTPAQWRNGSLAEGIACEAAVAIFGAAFGAVTLGLVLLVGLAGAGVFGALSYYT
ncbi:hypothetical protein B9Q06_10665 [Candidatus Marsarchaeota G2 archaeon ECH_B_2]|uniref:Uncharacterized protein n=3 Tax=Candidatus Marsarchaeota group 2 TaxID=2203771 RepID=A0A2R6B5U6_9ARCH|nr:MAG: hypothetical protein B9Q06_10665 [Candidatus Marsarchaeota G2 archaeon ECH_B_2]PSN98391.1 MAG: hypothetical protein B9Q07_09940 [Candidatus Marsarchaeota G2 archaeon ECH_B_3]PSO00143.1 MAG: hypothetical protein B9Q05_10760 [Candidatus Marsarchaeota G2 archaeon ECH_B_1]